MSLRFKGDPPLGKRKKRKLQSSTPGDDAIPAAGLEKVSCATEQDGIWIRVRKLAQLRGPCVVLFPDSTVPSVLCCLSESAEGRFAPHPGPAQEDTNRATESSEDLATNEMDIKGFEPTHVQQVFTVRPITGKSMAAGDEPRWTLCSSDGRYMSARKDGQVSFFKEAIDATEEWNFVFVPGTATVAIQSVWGTYLGIQDPLCKIGTKATAANGGKSTAPESWKVQCSACEIGFLERFVLKVQSRHARESGLGASSIAVEATAPSGRDALLAAKYYGSVKRARLELGKASAQGKQFETLLELRTKVKSDRYCK